LGREEVGKGSMRDGPLHSDKKRKPFRGYIQEERRDWMARGRV